MDERTMPADPTAECEETLESVQERAERLRRVVAAAEDGDERTMLAAMNDLEPNDTAEPTH